MNEFVGGLQAVVASVSGFMWTYLLSILLIGGGIFLAFKIKFFQFRFFGHMIHQTIGQIFKKNKHAGSITPFQAFTTTLGATAGATNIVGVPVAIALGGPGALFWMWAVALLGMGTRYCEIVLGVKYREKNKDGEWVGGPQYYIKKGLGWNKIAALFAFFLMLEAIPSVMVQSNSISTQLESSFGWSTMVTGLIIMLMVGLVVYGGIKRIGRVTDKVVPFMVLTYLIVCLIVIFANVTELPGVLGSIFLHAFTPISAAGGFAGAAIGQAIRWGIARGLYSNEAGLGTGPIANAAAQTDHPGKQGLWGILSVFLDTIVICSITGITVLVSGVWKTIGADNASSMTAAALSSLFGKGFGGVFISIFLFLFVITTVIVVIYYGEKQAEYLFGLKVSKGMRLVYTVSVFLGAIGGLQFIWQFLDLLLGMAVICNVVPLLFLHKDLKEITADYVERIYHGKSGSAKVRLFTDAQPEMKKEGTSMN